MRIVHNVSTGETEKIPLTDEEIAENKVKTAAEMARKDAERLEQLKRAAEMAEAVKRVDIETGTTLEAIAYRTEKTRQGKD